jgi:type IX secretion system PorP/SprF family membrane protein
LSLLLCGWSVFAQNQYLFNNYIANQGMLNPAYNGSRDDISGLLLHRSQWIGFEGAPMLDALNVHGAIEETNFGVGGFIINDHHGFSNTLDFMAAGSYKLQFGGGRAGDDMTLMLGLQMGLSSMIYDGTKAITDNFGDPVFKGKESKVFFNSGFGAYFYTEDYFAGFSIPRFFSPNFDMQSETHKNQFDFKNMHMYLYGGYVFDFQGTLVRPTLLVKQVYGAPMQFDVSGAVYLMESLWLGLTYRTVAEAVFFADYKISRQFTLRYSFDYSFSPVQPWAKFGSHEIGLQFDFSFQPRTGMKTIRHW